MGHSNTVDDVLRQSFDDDQHGRGISAPRQSHLEHWGRIIGGDLGWHPLLLLGLLIGLLFYVTADNVWSADIGARLYQAQVLTSTGEWTTAHPFPRADRDSQYFPIHFALRTEADFQLIALAKHPAWTWMTAGLMRVGGVRAVIGIEALGTFAAALGSARLLAISRPKLAVACLWFTGLITPLFFDSFIGYGHSFAAALVIWAAYLVARFAESIHNNTEVDGVRLVGAAVLLVTACLIRTEAVLLGIALVGGLLAGSYSAASRLRWFLAAGTIAFTVGATAVLERLAIPDHLGLANPGQNVDDWGFVDGRLTGLQQTWLSPGRSSIDILIVVSAVLMLSAGLLARDRKKSLLVEAAVGVALAAVLARVLQPEPVLVFGLVMACPLLVIGFVRGFTVSLRQHECRMAAVTFSLFAVAVLATQYPFGGVAEWGGRYFAIGLPFAAVVAVPGLETAAAAFSRYRRRRVMALALATAMLLNLAGISSLRQSRLRTGAMVEEIDQAMAATTIFTLGDAEPPVVVTTTGAVGRLSWNIVDKGRWLLVDADDLTEMAERLANLDISKFTLVTFNADQEVDAVSQHYEPLQWPKTDNAAGDVIIMTAVD